ncbi:MAG: hypothetical protein KI793_31260 [Rivularia sp. (in: Bacteria)]|nr:hypothetical protein [Rivularia sp. MS3]
MKLFKKRSIFSCGLSLSLVISGAVLIASQQKSVSNSPSAQAEIPTINWQNTRLPNWNQITFSKMPAITESGSFQAPGNVSQKLGYDPSRSWDAGEKPSAFTMLGDFQDSFKLQEFSLLDISQITGSDIQETDLEKFGVVKFQTIESLVKAIPDLEEWRIRDIKPIYDLLSQNLSTSFSSSQTISNLLKNSPHLGKLSFESLDLVSYNIDSIPGLSATPIASFDKWQGVYIDEVPGLSDVPFSQFPNPVNPVGMQVGIVDVAFATDEQKRDRTISGSNKEGFAVPCDKDCAHIELSGSQAVHGKAWVSGKYQLVKGGRGILGSVNGGKEPTGRNLFGDAFKVAVWDVSEVDGKVSQSLFFRVCMRNNFVDLGCTPYFIGPVPFISYKEKEAIFLGRIDSKKNSMSTPTGLKSSGFTFDNSPIISSSKKNNVSDLIPVAQGDCRNIHSSGPNLDALSSALLDIENNKETQDFSLSQQQSSILTETSNLLSITSQQTDPSTGKPFSEDRLIERASQMHFAGVNIPIDSQIRDVSKGMTVFEYGNKVSAKYKQKLSSMNCLSN